MKFLLVLVLYLPVGNGAEHFFKVFINSLLCLHLYGFSECYEESAIRCKAQFVFRSICSIKSFNNDASI